MKKLFILVPLLLAGLIVVASSQESYDPFRAGVLRDPQDIARLENDPSVQVRWGRMGAKYDFAPYPRVGVPVTDGIPAFTVRFDDGDVEVLTEAKYFIDRNIPVLLAINPNQVGLNANKLDWDDINELKNYKSAVGRGLFSIGQHGNFNFTVLDSFPSGTETSTIIDDSLRANLDPALIIEKTGIRPRIFIQPGDAGRLDWMTRNRPYFFQLLDEYGFWYAWFGDTWQYNGITPYVPSDFDNIQSDNLGANTVPLNKGALRPGMVKDRHYIPNLQTDLGNHAVERPTRAQWAAAKAAGDIYDDPLNPLPLTADFSDGWTMVQKGVDPTSDGDAAKLTFGAMLYQHLLSGNFGGIFPIHSEDRNWVGTTVLSDAITGLSDAEEVGSWHSEKVAWTFRALELKGHVRMLRAEEWCEWVLGKYKAGVDIISNPHAIIPQFDIGDTVGTVQEYPWIRGWSSEGHYFGGLAFPNNGPVHGLRSYGDAVAVEALRGFASSRTDSTVLGHIGANVKGAWNSEGGLLLVADKPDIFELSLGALPPGDYELRMSMNMNSNTAPQYKLYEFGAAGAWRAATLQRSHNDTHANWNGRHAYADTILTLWQQDETGANSSNMVFDSTYDGVWTQFRMPLSFPKDYPWNVVPGALSDWPDSLGVSTPIMNRNWTADPMYAIAGKFQLNASEVDSLMGGDVGLTVKSKYGTSRSL